MTNVMPVSQLEEDKAQKKKRWLSIYIMYFTMFMSAVSKLKWMRINVYFLHFFTNLILIFFFSAFSVVLSSIWPYLTEVSNTTNTIV